MSANCNFNILSLFRNGIAQFKIQSEQNQSNKFKTYLSFFFEGCTKFQAFEEGYKQGLFSVADFSWIHKIIASITSLYGITRQNSFTFPKSAKIVSIITYPVVPVRLNEISLPVPQWKKGGFQWQISAEFTRSLRRWLVIMVARQNSFTFHKLAKIVSIITYL